MRGIGDVAHREHAAAGSLHVAVDHEIAERVGRERKLGEPRFVRIRPIAEQQNHMVDLAVATAVQPDADPGSAVVERMTMVTRTPLSASMRETSKALSPPPITATCDPESRLSSPTAAAPT